MDPIHGLSAAPCLSFARLAPRHLENCGNYSTTLRADFFLKRVKEILLKIGFIEEMRTTWGNKEVPKPFSSINFSRENTIQSIWLRTNGNPAFHNFCDITKGVLKITAGSLRLQVLVAVGKFSDLRITAPRYSNRVF